MERSTHPGSRSKRQDTRDSRNGRHWARKHNLILLTDCSSVDTNKELAHRAKALGMSIHYHNRNPLPQDKERGATYVSFNDLISQSDVISLNLSLSEATRHIIGPIELAKMKDGVVIVNTARGALIDEKALVNALDSGKVCHPSMHMRTFYLHTKVYSAGLDVYEKEPAIEHGLLTNPNVFLLPHIGTATYETQREMEILVLDNLRKAVTDGELITPIVEQKSNSRSK